MNLRFGPDALDDLQGLKEWLHSRSPAGYRNVVSAITKTIRFLKRHPHSGRNTDRPDIREIIERRYGFIIPYTVIDDTIWILRVYNARREPPGEVSAPDLTPH